MARRGLSPAALLSVLLAAALLVALLASWTRPWTLRVGCRRDVAVFCHVVRSARDLISRRVGLSPLDASRSPTLLSLYR